MAQKLPPGYWIERDAEHAHLIAPNGKRVATFNACTPEEQIEQVAQEHADSVDVAMGRLERLLSERRAVARRGGGRDGPRATPISRHLKALPVPCL